MNTKGYIIRSFKVHSKDFFSKEFLTKSIIVTKLLNKWLELY